jgi:hypothetical protein
MRDPWAARRSGRHGGTEGPGGRGAASLRREPDLPPGGEAQFIILLPLPATARAAEGGSSPTIVLRGLPSGAADGGVAAHWHENCN